MLSYWQRWCKRMIEGITRIHSPAQNSRVRMLVVHFTELDTAAALAALQGSVSAHYLVGDGSDEYRVRQLVDEKNCAWHAGVAVWQKMRPINNISIGVEIVYQPHGDQYPPYDPHQIQVVAQLLQRIQQRHDIQPINIVGHSDIAPHRKHDPGPMFPWAQLAQQGIGAWYDATTYERWHAYFDTHGLPSNKQFWQWLQAYGYGTTHFTACVRAFQLHFRADNISGDVDVQSAAILAALLEKYTDTTLLTG